MIASLTGILKSKTPTEVLIDVNGVGYSVSIPVSTYEKLGQVNSVALLLTYLHVRDDGMQLYGFATEEERSLFKLLISISGIGPKIAQAILSGTSVAELKHHILNNNIGALTTIPNVGRKTAERLVLELKDKITKIESIKTTAQPISGEKENVRAEALMALASLGFNRAAAEKAIRVALSETDGVDLSVEELIKRALRHSSSK